MPLKETGGRRQHGSDHECHHNRKKKRFRDVKNRDNTDDQQRDQRERNHLCATSDRRSLAIAVRQRRTYRFIGMNTHNLALPAPRANTAAVAQSYYEPGSLTSNPLSLQTFHRGNVMRRSVGRRVSADWWRNCGASVAFVIQEIGVLHIERGNLMTQALTGFLRQSPRETNALIFAAALLLAPAIFSSEAGAQVLGYASAPQSAFPSDNMMLTPPASAPTDEGDGSGNVVPERLRRTIVAFDTREAPGTVIIDTGNTVLYYVLGQNRAIRYGVGVGREGFTWSGVQTISRKAEWPDWHPPAEMIVRQPYLPRFMAGGPGNPLGARAMYLGSSVYRIHGTNNPSTIGKFVSSGCIRLTNEDVADLFSRVDVGTRVVVLPKHSRRLDARKKMTGQATAAPLHPVATTLPWGRQGITLSMSSLY